MDYIMKSLFSLENRKVLLSGAGGYLGQEIAKGLALAKAHVLLCGRTLETLQHSQRLIQDLGASAEIYLVDLKDEQSTRSMIDEIKAKHQSLHVIINNANSGMANSKDIPRDHYLDSYNINVAAAQQLIMGLISELRRGALEAEGGSSVINIASMYGHVSPRPELYENLESINPPFYGAAKAGLIQLTKYFACMYGAERIRVNCISPGPFPNKNVQKDEKFCNGLANNLPMKRIGKPAELAGPVLFLASDAASYVNGINMPVDGGWTAW